MDAHIQIQFNKLHYSTNGLNLFFSRPKTLSLKFLAESKVATPKNVKGMPDIAIITKGVEGFLNGLDTNKASGPDKSPRDSLRNYIMIGPILIKIFKSFLS